MDFDSGVEISFLETSFYLFVSFFDICLLYVDII